MSGHKATRRARQNPAPKPITIAAPMPPAIVPGASSLDETCGCCCDYCDTIAWIHADCDPYCDCEVGN